MPNYRDQLIERYGKDSDIGSVVGCALDRLNRPCSAGEIDRAIGYFRANEAKLSAMSIGARRDQVVRFINGELE